MYLDLFVKFVSKKKKKNFYVWNILINKEINDCLSRFQIESLLQDICLEN